jgi:excisionase family DNA binding protein
LLKLNPQTVRNWIDRGELPAVHIGRRVRVRRADFDRMIEKSYISTGKPPGEPPRTSIWDGNVPPPMVP